MTRYAPGPPDAAAAAPTTKDRYPALRGDGSASFLVPVPRGQPVPPQWPGRASVPGPSGGSRTAGDRRASARAPPAAPPRGYPPEPMHSVQCQSIRVPCFASSPASRAPPARLLLDADSDFRLDPTLLHGVNRRTLMYGGRALDALVLKTSMIDVRIDPQRLQMLVGQLSPAGADFLHLRRSRLESMLAPVGVGPFDFSLRTESIGGNLPGRGQ